MKKFYIFLVVFMFFVVPVSAKIDRTSAEYLKNKRHFSIMNPAVERVAQRVIRSLIKDESGHNFKVKLQGYTFSSMKKGIFKYLEIVGEDFFVEDIPISYAEVKTLTDYNWIDYKQEPPVCKTDMVFSYQVKLSEESINIALQKKEYDKVLEDLNKRAYPLFTMNDVKVRIKNNKLYLVMFYNFPISPMAKDRSFSVSTGFKVFNNKIIADNIMLNPAYRSLQSDKIANLVNRLDPLSFTLSIMNTKKCNAKVENVKIIDDLVEVNGKIYVKGD